MAGRREATRPAIENVAGLDTIRFLAALCVVLGHGASFPLAAYIPEKVGMWRVLMGLNSSLFNGVAAVLVFFAVSGFCIHYRFAAGAVFRAAPFLCRRLLRIGIPIAGASAVAHLVGPGARAALDAVIWTLYCEIIYYAIYPTLSKGLQQDVDLAFGGMVLRCSCASLFLPRTDQDRISSFAIPFHSLSVFWMERAYFQHACPPRGLEWAGGWSYSIYLMHGTVFAALQALAGIWEPTAFWIFKWLGVLLVSYTFFVLVEQPAQHLARNLGYRLSGTRPDSSG